MTELFTLTPPEEEDVYGFALGFPDDAEYYVLDAKRRPVPASQDEFEAMPNEAKLVAEVKVGEVTISTEFIGFDNSDGEDEQPLVFQTFIRSLTGERHGECFATWSEAAADHARTVEHLRRSAGALETRH